jgi:hypothetical protein
MLMSEEGTREHRCKGIEMMRGRMEPFTMLIVV